MNEFNLDELRGRAGATREAYHDSIKMTRALRMRLIETEFEVRRREDLIKKEKPMDNKGTGKVRTYSATSALRELHHILSHALRTDGIHSFNRVTMSGNWFAETDEEAEQILEALDARIDELYSQEIDAKLTGDEVHCLKCDGVFAETTSPISVCPHCGNDDMTETVYLQKECIA